MLQKLLMSRPKTKVGFLEHTNNKNLLLTVMLKSDSMRIPLIARTHWLFNHDNAILITSRLDVGGTKQSIT